MIVWNGNSHKYFMTPRLAWKSKDERGFTCRNSSSVILPSWLMSSIWNSDLKSSRFMVQNSSRNSRLRFWNLTNSFQSMYPFWSESVSDLKEVIYWMRIVLFTVHGLGRDIVSLVKNRHYYYMGKRHVVSFEQMTSPKICRGWLEGPRSLTHSLSW